MVLILLDFLLGGVGFVGISVGGVGFVTSFVYM